MSARQRTESQLDACVVGGGVVGSACALALARQGLRVAIIEPGAAPVWRADTRDLRVYAFAPDNAAWLDALQVWTSVRDARVQAYRRMCVWDAGGGSELRFDADTLGRGELGWIVEHGLLADRLWNAVIAAGVEVHGARVEACEQREAGVRLRLGDGQALDAHVCIAADGADSTLRSLAGIGVRRHDHAQRGVVAYAQSERPHEDTAWQRFAPAGPLAVLPFVDDPHLPSHAHGCISSIVWTLPDDEAERVLHLDDDAFGDALTSAFDRRLGAMRVCSARAAFALRTQLAERFIDGRVLLVGDAAHVVHPLAGQGANLGLRDVAALSHAIAEARARKRDFASPSHLARWARQRRSEAVVAAGTFDGINRVFSNDAVLPTLLRGHLLGMANALPPVAGALWRRASGI